MAIPMLKIRRPNGRLIFNMGIPIPGKDGLYIETGPCLCDLHRLTQYSTEMDFGTFRISAGIVLYYTCTMVCYTVETLYNTVNFSEILIKDTP